MSKFHNYKSFNHHLSVMMMIKGPNWSSFSFISIQINIIKKIGAGFFMLIFLRRCTSWYMTYNTLSIFTSTGTSQETKSSCRQQLFLPFHYRVTTTLRQKFDKFSSILGILLKCCIARYIFIYEHRQER